MTEATVDRCKDCGSTEGLGWWIGRFKKPGSAGPRCHECYLVYCSNRPSSKGRHQQRKPHPLRAVRLNKRREREMRQWCVSCGVKFHRVGGGVRCDPCSVEHRRRTRSNAEARRRAAELAGDRTIHWRTLGERDGWTCHLCGGKVPRVGGDARRMDGATVDHLVPIAEGGKHEWSNVALAHRQCNLSRGSRGAVQLRLVGESGAGA